MEYNRVTLIKKELDGAFEGDIDKLYEKVHTAITEQNLRGYKVVSITHLTGGKYDDSEGTSYGYSYTMGVLIVFEKTDL